MSGSGDRSRTGLTPATQLRLIWTETLVKCGLGATAREISPASCGPGSYGRARNCVSKIRINCRANRGDCNLTLGNVNWATLYSLQSNITRDEARLIVCFGENRIYPSNHFRNILQSMHHHTKITFPELSRKKEIENLCTYPKCSPLSSPAWSPTLVPPPLKASWYHLAPWSPPY